MPTIEVFDPAAIRAILDAADFCPDTGYNEPSQEERRLRYLNTMASDPRQGKRDLLVSDAALLASLRELAAAAPNFEQAAGVVIRAATLSLLTGSPLSLPPVLLLGPPGVGKSFFARRLAILLGVPLVEHAMNLADDPGVLIGHSASWRAARLGLIARTLIERESASPIFFVDEIEKALWTDNHGDPLDMFHSVLEMETARSFVDAYIAEAAIRADKIFWIATANDASALKTSLLDRFLVLTIRPPDEDGRAAILRAQFARALAATNAPLDPELDPAVLAALGATTPRQARLVLDLAIASAVSERRNRLTPEDVLAAVRLVMGGKRRTRIGF